MMRKFRVAVCAFWGLAALFALTGCGAEGLGGGELNKANPPGLYTDTTLQDYLALEFEDTKACANLEGGDFAELTVIMMEPQFPCRWYQSGCSGEFVTPNTVKLGSTYVWRHEVLHYLLYVNTGNSDSDHRSNLFSDCV